MSRQGHYVDFLYHSGHYIDNDPNGKLLKYPIMTWHGQKIHLLVTKMYRKKVQWLQHDKTETTLVSYAKTADHS